MNAHALRRQGWTISAIARYLGRDRKTIREYLNNERVPGHRRQAPDVFVPFLPYCRQRLADDPHLWASALFDEVTALGYEGAYSTFTRALRRYQVRPHCEPCHASTGRDIVVIAHPPGGALVRLAGVAASTRVVGCRQPRSPAGRGARPSGRWRAVLAESQDFPHLARPWTMWCASSAGPPAGGDSITWRASTIRPAGRSQRPSRRKPWPA
ncbi:transcriptional regulator [Streptomyces sp. M10(2022)]